MDGGGAASEPNKEPAANGTPSPGKRNVAKAKRLLPMELRKRRRAAKMQVTAGKKARVSLGATSSPQTPPKSTRSPGKATSTGGAKEEDQQKQTQVNSATATVAVVASPDQSAKKTSPSTPTERRSPLASAPAATATASTRLHSLYLPSLLSQKRQKRQLLLGTNVPNTFRVADLPQDMVPKTKLSILTAFPYPFQRLNSKIKKQALQSFLAGSGSSAERSDSHSAAVRWQEALHYFVHPAASVPTSILMNRATAANTSESLLGGPKGERKREEKAFFTARWNAWQESFRDLYMTFRRQFSSGSGDCYVGSFYVRSSDFVVYFLYDTGNQDEEMAHASIINLCRQHDSEAGGSEKGEGSKRTKNRKLRAVVSQSSARVRKVLHHLNVAYTMPYIKANQTQREVGEFHLLEEELEATRSRNKDRSGGSIIAPVTQATSTPENMHGADSLLLFHGHDAVHGLYEFLINRAPMANQDVPELYALQPFANASIQSLQVTSFGRVGGSATEPIAEDQPSRAATLFRTEISGFCFPSSVAKLLAVLKDEWEATKGPQTSSATQEPTSGGQNAQIALRVYMEAVAGAERLNAVTLGEQVADEKRGGGGDQQERQTRQQELEFSKRRMEIAVVAKVDSRYDVETTTRPIVVWR